MAEYHFPVAGYRGKVQHHHGKHKGGSDLFAPAGTPVLAMGDAEVVDAGHSKVGGYNVTLRGSDGLTYYYAHLAEPPLVQRGQRVRAGQQVGKVGDTGNAKGTGAHLHIGIGRSIQSGVGAAGGTGTDFDAVSHLTNAQQGRPTAPSTGRAAMPPTKRTTTTTTTSGASAGTGKKKALQDLLAQRKREASTLQQQVDVLSQPGTRAVQGAPETIGPDGKPVPAFVPPPGATESIEDDSEEGKALKKKREALLTQRREELASVRSQIQSLEKDIVTTPDDAPGGPTTKTVETETEGTPDGPSKLHFEKDASGRVWGIDPLTGKKIDVGLGSNADAEMTPNEAADNARADQQLEVSRLNSAIELMKAQVSEGTLDFSQAKDFLDRVEKTNALVQVGGKFYYGGMEPGGIADTISRRHGFAYTPAEVTMVDNAGAIGRSDLNQHLIQGPYKDMLDRAGIPTGQAAIPKSPLNPPEPVQETQPVAAQEPAAPPVAPPPPPPRGLTPGAGRNGVAPPLYLGAPIDPPDPALQPPPPPPPTPLQASGMPVTDPASLAANNPEATGPAPGRGPQLGAPLPGAPQMPAFKMPMLGAPVLDPEIQRLLSLGYSPDEAFQMMRR